MFPTSSGVKRYRGNSATRNTRRRRAKRLKKFQGRLSQDDDRISLGTWTKSYENVMQWQNSYQVKFWRKIADKLKRENDELKERLKYHEEMEEMERELAMEQKEVPEVEQSSSDHPQNTVEQSPEKSTTEENPVTTECVANEVL